MGKPPMLGAAFRGLTILSMLFMGLASTAEAARFHVRNGGTLASGPSAPDNWNLSNCYPSIAEASLHYSAPDSLLLADEVHELGQRATLPTFLGNQNLAPNTREATILIGPQGGFSSEGEVPVLEIRGLTLQGSEWESHVPAVRLVHTQGLLEQATIIGCEFRYLRSSNQDTISGGAGAALKLVGDGSGALIQISDCLFFRNHTEGPGGALAIGDDFRVQINATTFAENISREGFQGWAGAGGAVFIQSHNAPTYLRCQDVSFLDNKANGPGGALASWDANLHLENCIVSGSRSAFDGTTVWAAGAGIACIGSAGHAQDLEFTLNGCQILDNRGNLTLGATASDGGGVLVKAISGQVVEVSVTDCRFLHNFNGQGAGLYVGRFATGTVSRCLFQENTAYNSGGGLYKGGAFAENLGELVTVEFCDFIGNRTGLDGEGIAHDEFSHGGAFCTRLYPRAHFYHCTFLDNNAGPSNPQGDAIFMGADGGFFDTDLKRCRLVNCLFYGPNGADAQIRMGDAGLDLVSSCAWEPEQFAVTGVAPTGTVELPGNPCLSLTDPALYEGSPCIDQGTLTGLSPDIEGIPVPQGDLPDIGAHEFRTDWSAADHAPTPRPGTVHALTAWPNPFNPGGWLAFELSTEARVTVRVVDLAGRTVQTIRNATLLPGSHRLFWDGTDLSGRAVASGTYLLVLESGGDRLVRQVTLLK
jgi:hypothetical protein